MEAILALLQIFSLPLMFVYGIAYFMALRSYKIQFADELPGVWTRERGQARPFESWGATAYKLLLRTRGSEMEGHLLSPALRHCRKKALVRLYAASACFMVLLFSSLVKDALF